MMTKMVNLQEGQRQRSKAKFSNALPCGHKDTFAYEATRRVPVNDIYRHEYKTLVSYKGHVGSAHILPREYSLTGLSRRRVNSIKRKELCYRLDVDDMKTSPDLCHENKTSNPTSDISIERVEV